MRSIHLIVVCTLLVPIDRALGQSFVADTSFVAEAKAAAIKSFTDEVGVNSNFYNGSEYNEYSPQADEHPYYLQDWVYGSVNYDREQYENVPLLFDIAEDQLISSYLHGNSFRLVSDRISSFTIKDKRFVKVSNPQVTKGFYQLVYDGKTQFLIRRKKTFRTKVDGNALRNAFDFKIDHYLVKDGVFHTIRSQRALLSVLGDKKQELKKFIRERGIRFNTDKEASAYSILQYYDQITP